MSWFQVFAGDPSDWYSMPSGPPWWDGLWQDLRCVLWILATRAAPGFCVWAGYALASGEASFLMLGECMVASAVGLAWLRYLYERCVAYRQNRALKRSMQKSAQ